MLHGENRKPFSMVPGTEWQKFAFSAVWLGPSLIVAFLAT